MDLDTGTDGLELLRSWIADDRRPPMAETLDIRLVEVARGHAVFEGTPGERF
jgi:hypothetical protein